MITSQMLKGVLEGCILNIISKEETYGYEISQKLKAMGFGEISEGTIYPLLLRLIKNQLLNAVSKSSPSGPPRKYYSLTEKGKVECEAFKENWKELKIAVDNLAGGVNNE
ncbi:MAG: PadR family transcriptional regulator [Terrisporobacter sp.]|uniref:PadR family transcriptional regulator n=1 Tax=Terrisporobacter sp. TaxID=1965305 RepID=UPI002FCBD0DF